MGTGRGAVHEFLAGVDAHRGMDGGVEIHQRHGILTIFLGEVIGDAVGAAVLQAAAGQHHREGGALVAAATAAVEFGRTAKLGADGDEGLVEQAFLSFRSRMSAARAVSSSWMRRCWFCSPRCGCPSRCRS
jgi:hypothetical protein